jgi:hypothetical protein
LLKPGVLDGRKLNDQEEEVKYYVGPYCGSQGGAVHLGLFTDDACTVFSDAESDFKSLAGFALPYAYNVESIVGQECLSCLAIADENENDNNNDNNNDNGEEQDMVSETCGTVYTAAGKCEAYLPSGTTSDVNNNACNYMQGIKMVRYDGIVDTSASRPSAVATAFIVIFSMGFAAMAFYVWYLRTRLGVKQNTLL